MSIWARPPAEVGGPADGVLTGSQATVSVTFLTAPLPTAPFLAAPTVVGTLTSTILPRLTSPPRPDKRVPGAANAASWLLEPLAYARKNAGSSLLSVCRAGPSCVTFGPAGGTTAAGGAVSAGWPETTSPPPA